MARRTEYSQDSMGSVTEDMIYVAVGKDVKEGKAILLWALQNSGGKRICVLHVHQPALHIPFMGAKVPASSLKDEIVRQHQETERAKMLELLNKYIFFGRQSGRAAAPAAPQRAAGAGAAAPAAGAAVAGAPRASGAGPVAPAVPAPAAPAQ